LAWKIEFDEEAVKDLEKIAPKDQKKILKFIRHINAC
jgi:mRNA-degrading endonuclease RelE of RelBE toxin-antitoxin system